MKFEKAELKDIPQIMEIIKDAQKYLKNKGIDQWQNDYPNPEVLKEDIKKQNSFVIKKDNKIIAAAAIIFGEDPTYNLIEDGKWITKSGEYGVIHRAAVAENYKGQGVAAKFFRECEKMGHKRGAVSIRIDTHQDNLAMQRLIEKEGFKYCGIIYTEDGSRRLAYEKLI